MISPPGMLTEVAPRRLSTSPGRPAMRIFRPRMSSSEFTSRVYQPNIDGGLTPETKGRRPKSAYISSHSSWPPPYWIHATCSCGPRPFGTPP